MKKTKSRSDGFQPPGSARVPACEMRRPAASQGKSSKAREPKSTKSGDLQSPNQPNRDRRSPLPLRILTAAATLIAATLAPLQATTPRQILILVGTPGEDSYAERFATWTANVTITATRAGITPTVIDAETPDPREALTEFLKPLATPSDPATPPPSELWIILIGHGTDDGKTANFNLQGDDISQHEFAKLLAPIQRPIVFANLTASSGPFLEALSGPDRTIITATRGGKQRDFAHFGEFFTKSLADPVADLDKDGQTSLLEAFLAASTATTASYEADQRLPAENALIDDNGDKRGTPAEAFQGLTPKIAPMSTELPDGEIATRIVLIPSPEEAAIPENLKTQRTAIELQIARLKTQKPTLDEDTFYARLEILLIDLAHLYQKID